MKPRPVQRKGHKKALYFRGWGMRCSRVKARLVFLCSYVWVLSELNFWIENIFLITSIWKSKCLTGSILWLPYYFLALVGSFYIRSCLVNVMYIFGGQKEEGWVGHFLQSYWWLVGAIQSVRLVLCGYSLY